MTGASDLGGGWPRIGPGAEGTMVEFVQALVIERGAVLGVARTFAQPLRVS